MVYFTKEGTFILFSGFESGLNDCKFMQNTQKKEYSLQL